MKFKKPKVSIIINCHNGENYIEESIKSVKNQTYKNWEIIYFDNLSTDKSLAIVKSFVDKRIKIIKSKLFLSLYDARNKAIKYAKGKYVAFLDSDDWWVKSKLKEQIDFLNRNKKYKVVCTNVYLYHQKNKKILKWHSNLPSGHITQELLNKYTIGISTVLLEKKIFINNKFNKKYNIIGDYDFFIKLSRNHLIASLKKPLIFYRIHDSNFSNLKLDIYYSELKNWLIKNEKSFKRKNLKIIRVKLLLFKIAVKIIIQRFKNLITGV